MEDRGGGAVVLAGTGRCVADVGRSCESAPCRRGQFCRGGRCLRDHGTCRTDEDCSRGTCELSQGLVVQTAADTDSDEVPDAFDDCPFRWDPDQRDSDGDKVGDACDVQTCGNGVVEAGETCDGESPDGACPDRCRSDCTCPACVVVSSADARLRIAKRQGAMRLALQLPLDVYADGPVRFRLENLDGAIASGVVSPTRRSDRPSKVLRFRGPGPGITRVNIRRYPSRQHPRTLLRAAAQRWFRPIDADVAGTKLTVSVPGQCFTVAVTSKAE
jgi:hypothetical protein